MSAKQGHLSETNQNKQTDSTATQTKKLFSVETTPLYVMLNNLDTLGGESVPLREGDTTNFVVYIWCDIRSSDLDAYM